ncbi:MAG: hypothetical protein AAFX99_32225, partial [Myxococcota bacterium]
MLKTAPRCFAVLGTHLAHNPEAVESLSDAIDRSNFARVGPQGHEHALLLERLDDILTARRRLSGVVV